MENKQKETIALPRAAIAPFSYLLVSEIPLLAKTDSGLSYSALFDEAVIKSMEMIAVGAVNNLELA